MRKSLHVAALGVLAVTLACSSNAIPSSGSTDSQPASTATVDSVAQALVGTWTFVQGCGGFAYGCRSAEQLQEPTRYVFRTNQTVSAYRGSQELFTATYAIVPGKPEGAGDTRAVVTIGAGPTRDPRPLLVSFPSRDRLSLDEGCCDRYAFEYRRER